ncbi:protease complex subunit PrcB family protein [Alkaliphilus pronyensis]|uniref:Protease complex subunit PrcB family protein n=1 Tax=Alkaliphilus pronyensis TaxID=1482732 RepID=A0A6I0FA51_9FIRM|nr:protease complex subunit PrcB family protein [Alkaliphilus pronyensis]KAB3534178.1 protease complex subunit PrcB family protein [Alkaliphilus pronyensis]
MNKKLKLPKFPKVNWKLIIAVLVLILIVAVVVKVVPKLFSSDDEVAFVIVEDQDIPQKIQEILPRYRMLERALAIKIDEDIYVVVTRGEKLTGGYSVDIDGMTLTKEDDETLLTVFALFKDPRPEELVTQVITYPYTVAKTNLTELPKKISLQVEYVD